MNIAGTNIASPIRPFTSEDKYPTAHMDEIKGGYHVVSSMTTIDTELPIERRQEGMMVYIRDEQVHYEWVYNDDETPILSWSINNFMYTKYISTQALLDSNYISGNSFASLETGVFDTLGVSKFVLQTISNPNPLIIDVTQIAYITDRGGYSNVFELWVRTNSGGTWSIWKQLAGTSTGSTITADQQGALDYSNNPSQLNPYVTQSVIDGKVDKNGTDRLITTHEADKLAGINNHYRGTYLSYEALIVAIPFGNEGDEAIVDAVGIDPKKYIWDNTDEVWALGTGTSVTVEQSIIEGSINAVSGGSVFSALLGKISTSLMGVANGIATLGSNGKLKSEQMPDISTDVIELLEITSMIGEVVGMEENDVVFDTTDKKIYTYISEIWSNPTTPDADKLYLCKLDTLTYKWNGTTLVATISPLPYASSAVTAMGTSASTVTTPLAVYTAFKYWVTNVTLDSLNTTSKKLVGAINELFSGKVDKSGTNRLITIAEANLWDSKQDGTVNNITPVAGGGSYTILNNRVNNLRSVWLSAGTHNFNLAVVSNSNAVNEQYIIFRTGGTTPTIRYIQPWYLANGNISIVSDSAVATISGINAVSCYKPGQTLSISGTEYVISTVDSSTQLSLSVAATTSYSGLYYYTPALNYTYIPSVAINQLWHISFFYTFNGYVWLADISIKVI